MSDLKPCPFCGGEAYIGVSSDGYGVSCINDKCADLLTFDAIPTEAEAIEAWNTRAWTVSDNDVEVLGDVAEGLFRDLMEADPETAQIWARSWPELFTKWVKR